MALQRACLQRGAPAWLSLSPLADTCAPLPLLLALGRIWQPPGARGWGWVLRAETTRRVAGLAMGQAPGPGCPHWALPGPTALSCSSPSAPRCLSQSLLITEAFLT